MEGRVTIIGLGCVGTSIGLALREQEPSLEVIGHDVDSGTARESHRMGAIHKTHWNLPAACEGSSLVILALPLPAIRDTLQVLGQHLQDGCIVTDTASLKMPVLQWAQENLPDHVRFIGGAPLPGPRADVRAELVGPKAADADLFEGGLYCITPTKDATSETVNVLLDVVAALGARPLFLDPMEYDGLRAGVADLPALIAVTLLGATVDSPGWLEMRKVAGSEFAALTSPVATDVGDRLGVALLNRENLLRRLDMFLEQMVQMRQWLEQGDEQTLGKAYAHAAEVRARWLGRRAEGSWPDTADEMEKAPGVGQQLSQMLLGGLFGRRPPREEE
jgi:prephenate dehydrogenase